MSENERVNESEWVEITAAWQQYRDEIERLRNEEPAPDLRSWWRKWFGLPSPPRWRVWIRQTVLNAMQAKLKDAPFMQVLGLCDRLKDYGIEDRTADLDLTDISVNDFCPFHILRDRGGPLLSKKIQIVFARVPRDGDIVVLRIYQGWGPIPQSEIFTLIDLFDEYLTLGRDLKSPPLI